MMFLEGLYGQCLISGIYSQSRILDEFLMLHYNYNINRLVQSCARLLYEALSMLCLSAI